MMSEQIQGAAVAEAGPRQSPADKLNEMVQTVRELGTFVRRDDESWGSTKESARQDRTNGKRDK